MRLLTQLSFPRRYATTSMQRAVKASGNTIVQGGQNSRKRRKQRDKKKNSKQKVSQQSQADDELSSASADSSSSSESQAPPTGAPYSVPIFNWSANSCTVDALLSVLMPLLDVMSISAPDRIKGELKLDNWKKKKQNK